MVKHINLEQAIHDASLAIITDRITTQRELNKINSYRSFFGDSPDTIFREETNETARKSEVVIGELKRIDIFFVNDDANGIIEIMKAAETNTGLSAWSKLRIVNECQSALFDLCR